MPNCDKPLGVSAGLETRYIGDHQGRPPEAQRH